MSKKNLNAFYLSDPVFLTGATFLVGSKKEMCKYIIEETVVELDEEVKDYIENGDYDATVMPTEETEYLFVLFDKDMFSKQIVAHEMFHLVCALLNKHGVPFSEDTQETFAYMIGYYTKEFYKKVGKNGRI